MPENNGRELLLHGLKDIYDAEHRFAEALTTMAEKADDRMLADGFRRHREVTRGQIDRLEECFRAMGERPSREKCSGAEGLVEEYQSFVKKERPDAATLDVFAAGAALKVEHYEIAAYATMIDLALRLDLDSCARNLEDNLKEEEATAAELEMSARKLGAELTGSSAGIRGAISTLRAPARSGGVGAVGRAVRQQAAGALNRLEERGRKARTGSTRKRATTRKPTSRSKTGSRSTTGSRSKTRSATGARGRANGRSKATRSRSTTGRSRSTPARRGGSAARSTRRPSGRTGTRKATRSGSSRARSTRSRSSR